MNVLVRIWATWTVRPTVPEQSTSFLMNNTPRKTKYVHQKILWDDTKNDNRGTEWDWSERLLEPGEKWPEFLQKWAGLVELHLGGCRIGYWIDWSKSIFQEAWNWSKSPRERVRSSRLPSENPVISQSVLDEGVKLVLIYLIPVWHWSEFLQSGWVWSECLQEEATKGLKTQP